jgi:predicted porin
MSRFSLPFRAALLATPALFAFSSAQAQEFSGAVTLGYGNISASGEDGHINVLSLQGILDADFGNGFTVGADLGFARSNFDDEIGGGDINTTDIRIKPRYRFASGLTLGGYVEHLNLSSDGFDVGLTSYGVTLGYDTGTLDIEAFAGQTDLDEGGDDKIDDIGINVVYTPADNLAFGGSIARSSSDGSDIDTLRLGAAYALNDTWTLFGALESTDIEDIGVTAISIGASYDLTALMGQPATLSLELERTRLDTGDTDLNTVRLGVTMPFGKRGVQVPLNSAAHNALRPRHNAFPSLISQGLLF